VIAAAGGDVGTVMGRALEVETDANVAYAEVWVEEEFATRVTTDSTGRFVLRLPPGSRQVLRIAMIGYRSRMDTLNVPRSGGLVLEARLQPMPFDGPCSGIEMVCAPRRTASE
jgi:hypothetical protein